MYKKIILIILLFSVTFSSVNIYAQEKSTTTLNLKDATQLAVKNSRQLTRLGKTIKDLRRKYEGSYAVDVLNTDRYVMVDRLNELYAKLTSQKLMSLNEQGELLMLYTVLNDTEAVKNIKLEPYINSKDFPDAAACAAIVKSCLNKELTYLSIEDSIRQAFDSILSLKQGIYITQKSYELQKQRFNKAEKDLKNGTISEIDRLTIETEYKKQGLELKKLKRTLQNLEMSFKRQLGISLDTDIALVPYKSNPVYRIDKYENYLERALMNRYEITSLKMDLKAAEIQLYTFNLIYSFEFSTSELDLYKRNMELQIPGINNEIKEKQVAVEQELKRAYADLVDKRKTMENSKLSLETKKKSFEASKVLYKAGTLSSLDYNTAGVSVEMAQNDYDTKVREFDYSVYKFKNSYNIGPSYK
ncbi:TolC family protein [Ruminiclostridium cellulolyticum]|uniref:Outer membrane protein-like protein n=1 Tax=Ruminiclostridium cellulolyticum (strain ATCC 35319 / DSM 5812 / JCM 6584 / H10) TaxID=394503 RepID=B8I1P9_RUMCH|nr:TolC family protein [Ruminiclostridium cellulolyticum]ACL77684.1 Outer membrane protein-like protein [Ruminiclostridium cellulolyticum H10]